MSLLGKVKNMFGFSSKIEHKPDPIRGDLTRAVQRNERASQAAQEALEQMKMSDTMRQIAGKMK